jgi:sialic acid synthase SpsE
MSIEPLQVGDRLIGPGEPTFVIAEASINHNGSLARAKQLTVV